MEVDSNLVLISFSVIFVVGIIFTVVRHIELESVAIIIATSAVLLLGSILGLWVMVTIKEGQEWEQFKIAKQCVLKEHIKGDIKTGIGVAANGKIGVGIMPESDKEAYLCNDGVLYWR